MYPHRYISNDFSNTRFPVFLFIFSLCFSITFFKAGAQHTNAVRANQVKISAAVKRVEALQREALGMSGHDTDSAMLLAKQALHLSEKFRNDTCFAFAYMATGWCFYYAGNRDSAEYFLLKAVNIFHDCSFPKLEARCLLNLSYVYQDGEEYLKLMDCLKKARPLAEKSKDEIVVANIDLTIGSTYGDMQLYEKGKPYIFSAIAITKKFNDSGMLTGCYSACGYIYMQEARFDSALYYYHLNYALSTELKDYESIALASDNLGEVFQRKAVEAGCHLCIDSAHYYYKLALHWFTEMNSYGNIVYAKMNLGSILRMKKQYGSAEKFLLSAFHYFDSANDAKYAYNSAVHLSKLYEDLNNYRQAYRYNLIAQQYNASLETKRRTDSISKMFALYETEKRDRTIELLHAKAKLDQEKISRQHLVILFSAVSLVLIIVLAVGLVNRSRMKQQLKEVKVRNQLASDLHDEVGSSLSSILLLSNMAAKKVNENARNSLLEKISGNTKEVIDKMGDIVWMMNPKHDEGGSIREKLEQYIGRLKDAVPFSIQLDIGAAVDDMRIEMETRKSIFLIVKEALNNAVKYGAANSVSVSLQIADKSLRLRITDNGRGFNVRETPPGNGLGTMAMRAKNSGGNFVIASEPGQGTTIQATIPIPHFRQRNST